MSRTVIILRPLRTDGIIEQLVTETPCSILLIGIPVSWLIPGFRRGINEVFALMGCYIVLIGSWLPTFRDR